MSFLNGFARYFVFLIVILFCRDVLSAEATSERQLNVVATFSILADMVEQVGGGAVKVHSLVGWDQDSHVYQPSPKDIKLMRHADVLVLNGLGFEAWLHRLVKVSGFQGIKVVATEGIQVLNLDSGEAHAGHHDHSHHDDELDHQQEGEVSRADPHAWHSIEAAKVYVRNIQAALVAALPEHQESIIQRSEAYQASLSDLKSEVLARLEHIPEAHKSVMVPHDAFAYLARDLGLNFHSLRGATTHSDLSAAELAGVVRNIKQSQIRVIYSENVSNNKLIKQVVKETGVRFGGELVSGALSADVAPSYLALMRYNLNLFVEGLQ